MSKHLKSQWPATGAMVLIVLLTAWGNAWAMFAVASLVLVGALLFAKQGVRAVLAMAGGLFFAMLVAVLMRAWLEGGHAVTR